MGQNAKYAYVAMANAIEDAGLKPEDYESNPRVGGILGQADTSAENIDEVCAAVKGGKSIRAKIGPYRVTRTMSSSVSAVLSTLFKIQGTSYSIGSACATSAHCIGTHAADPARHSGHRLLRRGRVGRLALRLDVRRDGRALDAVQ